MRDTLGTWGFSRVRREFSVLAEGRHIFGRWPKPHRNRKPREKSLWHPRKMRERAIEEVITSPNSPIVQIATTPTTWKLLRETGSKFVYQRSDYLSKQSHSAIRHDTDYCEVMWGNWVQFRPSETHDNSPVVQFSITPPATHALPRFYSLKRLSQTCTQSPLIYL